MESIARPFGAWRCGALIVAFTLLIPAIGIAGDLPPTDELVVPDLPEVPPPQPPQGENETTVLEENETEVGPEENETVEQLPENEPDPGLPDLSWINLSQRDYLTNLEIDPATVGYYWNISTKFNLNAAQWNQIAQNGFAVVDSGDVATFEDAFKSYWIKDLPVFITTDTILNTFHLLFDQFLQTAENKTLGPIISNVSDRLLRDSATLHWMLTDSDLKDAVRDAVVFFGVASTLMETGESVPSYAQEDVADYVQKILDANIIEQAPGQDYTQYKPRGHYAGDPYLEKYFRTMMWFGRMSFFVSNESDVLQACVISILLRSNEEASSGWDKVYNITTFLVGRSDSLTPDEMLEAMTAALGGTDVALLDDPSAAGKMVTELQNDKYYRQKINSHIIMKPPSEMNEEIVFPKVFQFMGQRFIPDSEVMQNVMYDRVPVCGDQRRGLPSSLDVMATLGSPRALGHLEDELTRYNYSEQLQEVIESVKAKTADFWNQSVYFSLLRSYPEIIAGQENESYPDFMRTAAWADEKLNSASGSYAEIKHDTILYGKQPYSAGITCGTPDGMVEPYPSFYLRMRDLSLKMKAIIMENFIMNKFTTTYSMVFTEFANINEKLATISVKELEGEDLTSEESEFVREIYYRIEVGCGQYEYPGWLSELLNKAGVSKKTQDSRLVADIATDPGTLMPVPAPPRVLHVATGYVRTLIVAYEMPNGVVSFFVGPVYSFYEFPLEGFSRLNDEEWRELLDSPDRPPDPFWTSSFLV